MKIAFIGAGKMATALIDGLIKAGTYKPEDIWAARRSLIELETLKSRFAIQTTTNNVEAVSHVDVVVLAVKPHLFPIVLSELRAIILERKPLVISVASGVTYENIVQVLGPEVNVVRAMPNTPVVVGEGMTALFSAKRVRGQSFSHENEFCGGELAETEHFSMCLCQTIFDAVGKTLWLDDEDQMDVVTALSGSGPAYFFAMMEALENAAVSLGLPRDMANKLTIQTALGSAAMISKTGETAIHLREQITSKGGGTEVALAVMRTHHFEQMMLEVVDAAKKKYESTAVSADKGNGGLSGGRYGNSPS